MSSVHCASSEIQASFGRASCLSAIFDDLLDVLNVVEHGLYACEIEFANTSLYGRWCTSTLNENIPCLQCHGWRTQHSSRMSCRYIFVQTYFRELERVTGYTNRGTYLSCEIRAAERRRCKRRRFGRDECQHPALEPNGTQSRWRRWLVGWLWPYVSGEYASLLL